MKTTPSFSYPVTEAGLPRDWCTVPPTGNENLLHLSAQEIATTFWLLDSIHIGFSYTINNISKSRFVTLHSEVPPYLRIAEDPIFQYYFQSEDLECHTSLELQSIAQPEPFNGTYHLRFSLFERDINQLYTLTCDMLPNHHLLDQKPFSLFNRPLALNLLTISSHWQGTIHYITLTTKYHTFST